VIDAINPMNNDNVINQGATSVYQAVTGSDVTIGSDLYGATHFGEYDKYSIFSGDGIRYLFFGDPNKTLWGTMK
jgi:hypothetical protein